MTRREALRLLSTGLSTLTQFNGLVGSRFSDVSRRLITEAADLSAVSPELVPAIILENDRPEIKWLTDSFLFSTGPQFVAANAANVSRVEISYPLAVDNRRMIATILGIKVCGVNVVAADRYQLTAFGVVAGAPAPAFVTDTRSARASSGIGRAVVQTQIANNTPSVSGDILDEVSADVTGKDLLFHITPLILIQGTGSLIFPRYTVFTVAINKALRVVFWGYERLARPEELDGF